MRRQRSGLYFAAASKSKELPYRHFRQTVANSVPHDRYAELDSSIDDPRFWGLKQTQRSQWDSISSGDVVLFYTGDRTFSAAGNVAETSYSRSVAKQLWPDHHQQIRPEDDQQPWEYLIIFDQVTPIDVDSVQFLSTLDYEMEYPMGFMSPADQYMQEFRRRYGLASEFVEEHRV